MKESNAIIFRGHLKSEVSVAWSLKIHTIPFHILILRPLFVVTDSVTLS